MIQAQAEKFGYEEFDKEDVEEQKQKEKKSNKWGFIDADGNRYDTLTEVMEAQVKKFGFPGVDGIDEQKKDAAVVEVAKNQNQKPKPSNQWQFINEDGTTYDSLAELIQSQAEKHGYKEFKETTEEDKPAKKSSSSNKWSYIDVDGNSYDTLTEVLDAQVAKYGLPTDPKGQKDDKDKWIFVTKDGEYDSITDAIDADNVEFKKPEDRVAEETMTEEEKMYQQEAERLFESLLDVDKDSRWSRGTGNTVLPN